VGELRHRVGCTSWVLAIALAMPAVAGAAPAATFEGSPEAATTRQLAQQRGADELYRYLAPLEARFAGDSDYDYALGTAALDSGNLSQAVFALQRAVAGRPRFAGARMELARAYFAIGDNEAARREFAILEKEDPPPEARRAIAEYRAAVDRRAAAYRPQRTAYAELTSGYDSNANGAPDIQSFLDIPLDSRSQAAASAYYALGAGGLISHPFAADWRLLGSADGSYRANPDASFVDSQSLRVAGAVEWRPGAVELRLQPSYATVRLDGEENHDVTAVDASGVWHRERGQWSLNLRGGQTRYAGGLEILDVDTTLLGLAGQYRPAAMPRTQWFGALTLGTEDAIQPTSQFGRDLVGARLGLVVNVAPGHAVLASLAGLTSDYDGASLGSRSDDQIGGALGYEYGAWRPLGWTLRAQVSYVDNQSTVALYDYDRLEAGVSVRKEFR
jgi:tetratricopeptide (TPR) repeat protein